MNMPHTRGFRQLNDDAILRRAQAVARNNNLHTLSGLYMHDASLYHALKQRVLTGRLFAKGNAGWVQMGDSQLTAYAKKISEEHGLSSQGELIWLAPDLYHVLLKRRIKL